jgi:60 kDa SS-A/Ro ribonucleoprotein
LIEKYGLVRESIPNNLFDESVWTTLLENDMPFTAMLRNIRNMTKAGALKDLSKNAKIVCQMLESEEALKKARIHPLHVLKALMSYNPAFIKSQSYCGYVEKSDYTPNTAICDALESAFYKSFANVEPTGKNFLIGVDVSGSMSSPMPNCPEMTSCMAAAALAMVVARTEKNYKILGFSHVLKDLRITAKDSLGEAIKKSHDHNFGGTDISLLIRHAINNKLDVDCFVVISDNETWTGDQHPFEALKEYRKKMNKHNAKLVAIGTAATGYTFANERLSESMFGFSKKETEGTHGSESYFKESEGGKDFIDKLQKLSSVEKYEKVSGLIAQAVADGMEPKKAEEYLKQTYPEYEFAN